MFLPALQPKTIWEKTGRWDKMEPSLFKFKDQHEKDLALGSTHEEVITDLVGRFVNSYRDLPLYLYQIQNKFRNEIRSTGGLLRVREFLMKDLYSFHTSDEDRDAYYEKVRDSYFKIYKKLELKVLKTKADGGTFSDLSEEFQVVTPSGEDTIYVCEKCDFVINKEIVQEQKCPECEGNLKEEKAIEVGNIFPLKQAYAEVFNLYFTDAKGEKKIVSAGCYGIGISRCMGAIVEVCHDDKGIIWPESVAPFQVHLVGLDLDDSKVAIEAEKTVKLLEVEGVDVLFDDRVDVSAGAKFADADLIGIPYRIVISKKTTDKQSLRSDGLKLELKKRSEKETKFVTVNELIKLLKFYG